MNPFICFIFTPFFYYYYYPSKYIGEGNALFAELNAVMTAIEIAASKGFVHVWLETDSQLILQVFKSIIVVPSNLRSRWMNCIAFTHDISKLGLSLSNFDLFWYKKIVVDTYHIIRLRNTCKIWNCSSAVENLES